MLTRRQLRQLHGDDVPLHILEQDYVESVLLKGIYHATDILVFKGGTCLRKAYGLNRFSEDLDFSLKTGIIDGDQARTALAGGLEGMEKSGMTARLRGWKERGPAFLCKVSYEGPLFTGQEISRGNMEIEISRSFPFEPPDWKTIITEYPDTGTYSIQCMQSVEMLAEKFRTLRQRRKPRDLYDVWFLMTKGVRTGIDAVNRKLAEVGADDADSLGEIVGAYQVTEKEWERDLKVLIGRLPDLADIREELEELLGEG